MPHGEAGTAGLRHARSGSDRSGPARAGLIGAHDVPFKTKCFAENSAVSRFEPRLNSVAADANIAAARVGADAAHQGVELDRYLS